MLAAQYLKFWGVVFAAFALCGGAGTCRRAGTGGTPELVWSGSQAAGTAAAAGLTVPDAILAGCITG
jgi:hypothetical protein